MQEYMHVHALFFSILSVHFQSKVKWIYRLSIAILPCVRNIFFVTLYGIHIAVMLDLSITNLVKKNVSKRQTVLRMKEF